MERALTETTKPTEPMSYNNSQEFAVWCKTSQSEVDCKVASALAAARVAGCVWARVHATDELRAGDHVAFNTGTLYYYQHAIVTSIDGIIALNHLKGKDVSWLHLAI